MNIKITYNWLREYLETDADPYELQKYLSLCGPSIETVEKNDEDYVFDIEITSNRIDMASVYGIAQEAAAILPQFGKKAKLKFNLDNKYNFKQLPPIKQNKKLDIEIKYNADCPRFTAMVFSHVRLDKSPETISKRLQLCGIKSINNVIDISNYLMLSFGQPTHMFDYDRIKGKKMIVTLSAKGQQLTTLDGKTFTLPGGDIVIEDGSGELMDLCGIMGGDSSSITSQTETIVFFVQTYDKKRIRRTSMVTGQRTMAATYFEKGLDPARVEPTFVYGVELLNQLTGAVPDSELIDIYPHMRTEKTIKVYLKDIHRVMGIPIEEKTVTGILEALGFGVTRHEDVELAYPDGVSFEVTVPTYRSDDVSIKEDIIEEVARVSGYHNLPSNIVPLVYIKQPPEMEQLFRTQMKTKLYLKHIGLHEFLNYSMISEELINVLGMKPQDHLKIANTISKEIEYMRQSLLPSLIKNMKDNDGKQDILKIFEIAKTYEPVVGDLPDEQYRLAFATNTDFFDLKGMIEGLLHDLHITGVAVQKGTHDLLSQDSAAHLVFDGKTVGAMGMLRKDYAHAIGLTEDIFLAELDFTCIQKNAKIMGSYTEPLQYALIKLDATIETKKTFAELRKAAFEASLLLRDMTVTDTYKTNITLRFSFAHTDRNMTEEEAKQELTKIQKGI